MATTAQQIKSLEATDYRIVRLPDNDRNNRPWFALLLDGVEVDRGGKSMLAMIATAGIDSPFYAHHAKYAARLAAARTAR